MVREREGGREMVREREGGREMVRERERGRNCLPDSLWRTACKFLPVLPSAVNCSKSV